MTTTYITLSVLFFILAVLCEWAERKSRQWYRDRNLLRASGALMALGAAMAACAIWL